jgi:hypothetical protein
MLVSALLGLTLTSAADCGKPSTDGSAQSSIPSGATAAAGTSPAAAGLEPSANPLAFLAGFEGEIDGTMTEGTDGGAAVPLMLRVRGNDVRIEVPEALARGSGGPAGKPSYVIIHQDAKKAVIVSDATRQAMMVDLDASDSFLRNIAPGLEPRASSPRSASQPGETKITRTGRFARVAGYPCEEWEVTSDHREAAACVASQAAPWFTFPMSKPPADRGWMAELMDGKHVPLRFVAYDRDGTTEQRRVQVTRIEKKSLPATDFEPPAGYAVVDLGQMFKQLQGMASAFPPPRPPPPRSAQ